jgi:PAS domain S-box-containing protein
MREPTLGTPPTTTIEGEEAPSARLALWSLTRTPVLVATATGAVIETNPAWEAAFGFSPGDTSWRRLFSPSGAIEKWPERLTSAAPPPYPAEAEAELQHPDGRRVAVSLRAAPLRWEGEAALLCEVAPRAAADPLHDTSERLQRLQRSLHASRLGTWEWDLDSGEVTWSDSMYEIFRVERRRFGQTIAAMLARMHPDSIGRVNAEIARAVRDGSRIEVVARLNSGSAGGAHWVVLKAQAYRDGADKLVVGTAQDISDRILENEEKRRIEERLQAALGGIRDYAIFTLDAEGRVDTWTPGAEQMLGFTPAEILGQPQHVLKLHPEGDAGEVGGELRVAQATGRHETEGWLTSRDGSRWWGSVLTVPMRDREHGTLFGFARIVQDLTERHRAAAELAAASELLGSVVNASPLAIATVSAEGRIQLWNHAAVRMLGWSEEEALHRNAADLCGERVAELIAALGPEPIEAVELQCAHKSGEMLDVALSATLLPADPEQAVRPDRLVMLQDITERKRAELMDMRLRQSERMITVGEMSASVAHEVSNPMAAIVALSHLVLETPGAVVDEATRENIAVIRQEAERASGILQRLLRISRKRGTTKTEMSLNERAEYILSARAYPMRNADIQVITELDAELPPVVADPERIEGVLLNLVVNAEHALREREGAQLLVRSYRSDDSVFLEIADNGPGIEPHLVEKIFETFVTTKKEGEGTGIGLSVSLAVLKEHGGSLTADNDSPLGGARFTLRLPLGRPEHPAAREDGTGAFGEIEEHPAPAAGEGAAAQAVCRVLVADDEAPLRGAVCSFLQQQGGYDVQSAEDGNQVLEKLRAGEDFDVLVLDVWMPNGPSPDIWDPLLAEFPHIERRVVFMSGDMMSPTTSAFIQRTRRPCIPKPFNPAHLERLVRKVFSQTQRAAAGEGASA